MNLGETPLSPSHRPSSVSLNVLCFVFFSRSVSRASPQTCADCSAQRACQPCSARQAACTEWGCIHLGVGGTLSFAKSTVCSWGPCLPRGDTHHTSRWEHFSPPPCPASPLRSLLISLFCFMHGPSGCLVFHLTFDLSPF